MKKTQVLLITGPAGSGKTTLAQKVAEKLGWRYVSEDEYWVKNGWSGHRTEEQEQTVQRMVIDDIVDMCIKNQGVVLEFILYKDPPNPLTEYQKALEAKSLQYETIALKPSLEEIVRRLNERGRDEDIKDMENRRKFAQTQIRCLESEYIAQFVVDSTNLSVDELSDLCIEKVSK